MLEARSIAIVGASPRPGSFGQRMVEEVLRSPAAPQVHLVNPRYAEIGDRRCVPSLAELPGPVDLVLLGVPDAALEEQLALAARRGDAAAVIFGSAHDEAARPAGNSTSSASAPAPGTAQLRDRLTAIARPAGLQVCGAGCMGFVNVSRGLRAIGYAEPDPLPAGPIALVTHSGSVFSAMLRTRRAIGFTLAVSSGQELVTTAPAYLEYALELPETRVLALVLETMREAGRLRSVLAAAAARDIPVVLLTAGGSASGRAMVAAHSGALAAADGGWEALARAYDVHRVGDLAEMADTLELFAIGRRAGGRRGEDGRAADRREPYPRAARGIATVHDSGLERAHAADLAEELGVPFAPISDATKEQLARILDPGLEPVNPLDVWGTGAATRELFANSLTTLAADDNVGAVALSVDLVPELDGDDSYPQAVRDAAAQTDKPVAVLSNLPSGIDAELAISLRQAGIPVLEGLRSGLLALSHLVRHAAAADAGPAAQGNQGEPGSGESAGIEPAAAETAAAGPAGAPAQTGRTRRQRGSALLAAGQASGAALLQLLGEYGITAIRARPAADAQAAAAAAASIGYPVVLKTDEPGIAHKSDVGGVLLGLRTPQELAAGYADLAGRLGCHVLVCGTAPPGVELALGIARDPQLGPLIVLGAGGILVELLADRVVALPPVDTAGARRLLGELRVSQLLAGVRGAPPADTSAIARAVAGMSAIAAELGDQLEALDVNPLICGPAGAVAVDALAVTRAATPYSQ
ncbi:MAG: acetate--CoA ligase family protein [Streptosporangiaceae bacterium]